MSSTSTQLNSYGQGYAGWLGEGGVVAVPWFALDLATVAIRTKRQPWRGSASDEPRHDPRHQLTCMGYSTRQRLGTGEALRSEWSRA